MWEHYRKYLLASQILIGLGCVALLIAGMNWVGVLACLLMMQVANVLGAAWAVRMKRKFTAKENRLPLSPR